MLNRLDAPTVLMACYRFAEFSLGMVEAVELLEMGGWRIVLVWETQGQFAECPGFELLGSATSWVLCNVQCELVCLLLQCRALAVPDDFLLSTLETVPPISGWAVQKHFFYGPAM